MFKSTSTNFFLTDDHEQIFYLKNFSDYDPDRPILVFNYGLVCSNHHWRFQVDYFDQKNYQILLHDYRGHFQSSGKNNIDQLTFAQMAHDIHHLCRSLGIQKAHFIGHSMGVNVTLELARIYPETLQSMTLISGTFVPVNDVMFDTYLMEFIGPLCRRGLQMYPGLFSKAWSYVGVNPLIREIVHSTGFYKQNVSKEFIEIYLNRVGQLGPEIFFQLLNEMTHQNIASSLEQMEMPALIIGGHKDSVIPNYLQRTLAQLLPNSTSYFLFNGSHVPQVDFPLFINERIEYFLTE